MALTALSPVWPKVVGAEFVLLFVLVGPVDRGPLFALLEIADARHMPNTSANMTRPTMEKMSGIRDRSDEPSWQKLQSWQKVKPQE